MIERLQPYPQYKDSGLPWLGKIPAHWEVQRLKNKLVRNDSGVWGKHFDPHGSIVLRSTEQTSDGGWRIKNPARIILAEAERQATLLAEGDLVVTKSSGSPAHIGKASLVTFSIAKLKCCFSNFMQRLRVCHKTSPRFVWYLLNSPVGREQLVVYSTTTTGLGNLNGTIIGNLIFGFPQPAEQEAIVRYLDWVNGRVERVLRAKQKLIARLGELKQAIIHRAVTGQVDVRTGQPYPRYKPSGLPWLGQIPEHWEVKRLKYLVRGKLQYGVSAESAYDNREWPRYVRITDFDATGALRNETFRSLPPDIAEDYLLREGDILFARSGATAGKTFQFRNHKGKACFAGYLIRACPNESEILSDYLYLFTKSSAYQRWRDSIFIQATIENIAADKYANLVVPVPKLTEQARIMDYIADETKPFDTAIALAEREIGLLREYRTRLVADVVTGKLDVRAAARQLPAEEPPPEEELAQEGLSDRSDWSDEEEPATLSP